MLYTTLKDAPESAAIDVNITPTLAILMVFGIIATVCAVALVVALADMLTGPSVSLPRASNVQEFGVRLHSCFA